MKFIQEENGYTLVESLVAMMLFAGILIPFMGTMSNLMFDRQNVDLYRAFHIAQSEMNRIATEQDFGATGTTITDGFLIDRNIERREQLIDIRVSVASAKKPEKQLIQLNRTVLQHKR